MDYTTLDQLVNRYGRRLLVELTDRADNPTGEIDAAIVSGVITSAQALVDGHLANQYALPLSEVPELVSQVTEALAIYDLHIYEAPESIKDGAKNARDTLKQIGDGRIRLPIAGNEPATKGTNDVRVTKRDRPFTARSMTGLI